MQVEFEDGYGVFSLVKDQLTRCNPKGFGNK